MIDPSPDGKPPRIYGAKWITYAPTRPPPARLRATGAERLRHADGPNDLAFISGPYLDGTPSLFVLRNDGDGGLSLVQEDDLVELTQAPDDMGGMGGSSGSSPLDGLSGLALLPYDIDGDGNEELFVGGLRYGVQPVEPGNALLSQNSMGAFMLADFVLQVPKWIGNNGRCAGANLGGDERLDVYCEGDPGGGIALRNDEGFQEIPWDLSGLNSWKLGMFDGDDKLDLLAMANDGPVASWGWVTLPGEGSGQFGSRTTIPVGTYDYEDMPVADFNCDGFDDFVASDIYGEPDYFKPFFSNGMGQFPETGETLAASSNPAKIAPDLDGDGYPDLIVDLQGIEVLLARPGFSLGSDDP